MSEIKKQPMKYKKIIFAISACLSLIMVGFGGAKFLVYILLLLTGVFLGAKYTQLKQLYTDYRLGLRINAIQYSQKETDAMRDKMTALEGDLRTANERLKLYSASMQSSKQNGGFINDNQPSNRFAGVRQDAIFDGERD